MVDYESKYQAENMIKYLGYLTRVLKRYEHRIKDFRIRIIIIYTADVEKADNCLDIGCLKLITEQAYLSSLETEKIFLELKTKVEKGQDLLDDDLMKLIILPLSAKKKEDKNKYIYEVIEMTTDIKDEKKQAFVLSGVLTFADKIIDDELGMKIRRMISMTKIGKMILEDGIEIGMEKGIKKGIERGTLQIAEKMLELGKTAEEIQEITGLSKEEVENIKLRHLQLNGI